MMSSRLIDAMLRATAGILAPGGDRGRLSILIYHRVLARPDGLNDWDVTAQEFEGQMKALVTNFSLLPVGEAVERLSKRSLPQRAICVTFDDGYADNAEIALPILQRCNIAATFFVATAFINGGRMWNDTVVESIRSLHGPSVNLGQAGAGVVSLVSNGQKRAAIERILREWKRLPPAERQSRADALGAIAGISGESPLMMRDDQVKALRCAGMHIGAHTASHPILTQVPDSVARREINESREVLQDLLHEPVELFAYPNGKPGVDYNASHVTMARDAGYRAAFSTAAGVATPECDRYQFPRFTPWDRHPLRFSFRLAMNFRNAIPETVRAS